MTVIELHKYDLRHVVERLPRDVRDLLSDHPRKLFVAGGFVRAVVAGEKPSDIDIFGGDPEWLENVARGFMARRPGARLHKSKNALTILSPERMPVQFITRWTFEDDVGDGSRARRKSAQEKLADSFDFTVCQAAIWRNGNQSNRPWRSITGPRFYSDLAARRLHYTVPRRIEEAGGSLLRVIKYIQRGYSIQVESLAQVVARLNSAVTPERVPGGAGDEIGVAAVYAGLLREVDPMLTIDGLEVSFDHETDAPINTDKED